MTKCPACLSAKRKIIFYSPRDWEYQSQSGIENAICRCQNCNSLYPIKKLPESILSSCYSDGYQDYQSKKNLLFFVSKAYIFISAFFLYLKVRNKNILDYGAGFGYFLKQFKLFSAAAVLGYEPFHYDKTEEGIIFSSISEIKKTGINFDYIRMMHVIEHIADFDREFKKIDKLSKPGTVIFGQTPNAEHFAINIFGRFWGHLHYPYHTVIFSKRGLELLCQRYGYKLIKVSNSIPATGWALSFENILKKYFFKGTKGRLPGYGIISVILIPISFFESLIGSPKTSGFNFYIRKIK